MTKIKWAKKIWGKKWNGKNRLIYLWNSEMFRMIFFSSLFSLNAICAHVVKSWFRLSMIAQAANTWRRRKTAVDWIIIVFPLFVRRLFFPRSNLWKRWNHNLSFVMFSVLVSTRKKHEKKDHMNRCRLQMWNRRWNVVRKRIAKQTWKKLL